jgi:tetratricopeptide (TPR) repeat protein
VAQDETAVEPAVRDRLHTLRAHLDADDRDRRFIARFDEILGGVIVWNSRRSQFKSEEAFFQIKDAFQSTYGINLGGTPPAEVASFIQHRSKPIRENLLAALDVCLARVPSEDQAAQRWLTQALTTADSDFWRARARHALAAGDGPALEKLVNEPNVARQRPALLHLLASSLPAEAFETKAQLLSQIQQLFPGEFWAHGRFAVAMSHDLLAWHLATLSDPEFRDEKRSLELAKEAVRLAPNDGDFRNTLGVAHYRVGNLNDAVASLEKAVQLSNGGDSIDWFFLAMAHWRLNDEVEARKWYDKAVEGIDNKNLAPYREELRRFRAEAAELLGVNEKTN